MSFRWRGPSLLMELGLFYALIVVAFIAAAALVETIEYHEAVPAIEALRSDLERVPETGSEDVIGQATEWNQTIATKRYWNRLPVVNLLIPNGWDTIERLEPQTGEKSNE